jgi:hypothetical protein
MDQPTPCCRNPLTLTGPSPFSKILALGFYDGPTSGVLQCRQCGAVHRFDMLDWTEDHNVRVFRLALLPADALERCVRALCGYSPPPRWPVWVPVRWQGGGEDTRAAADREVQSMLATAGPPALIVAWEGYGERMMAARRLPAEELLDIPDWFSLEEPAGGRDWFALLGLSRRGTLQAS